MVRCILIVLWRPIFRAISAGARLTNGWAQNKHDDAVQAHLGRAVSVFDPLRQSLLRHGEEASARASEHELRAKRHYWQRDTHLADAARSATLAANIEKLMTERL